MESEMTEPNDDVVPNAGRPPLENAALVVSVAVLLGVLVDVLFFEQRLGLNLPLFAALCVVALVALGLRNHVRPAIGPFALAVAGLLLAGFVAVRSEPMTVFVSAAVGLVLLVMWISMFARGRLWQWGVLDLLLSFVLVLVNTVSGPFLALRDALSQSRGGGSQATAAWVRGLLLALPLLCVFTLLLTSADLIFADQVQQFLEWLGLDDIPELVARLILVLMSAFTLLGLAVQALLPLIRQPVPDDDAPLVPPLLGMTETTIVLGGLAALFAFFVVIQFRYLFGGAVYVSETAISYSEYARRGFGELVAVVVLTLLVLLAFANLTRREGRRARWQFLGLVAVVSALVLVIDVSAVQRLLTYEAVFGFTRLRTYSHVATIWLGLLFAPLLIGLAAQRLRWFAGGMVLCFFGFAASLALLNVDGFITRTNISYAAQAGELDVRYLTTLSPDALPEMLAVLEPVPGDLTPERAAEREANRHYIGAYLACQQQLLNDQAAEDDWRNWHWGRDRARTALAAVNPLSDWPVTPIYFAEDKTLSGYGMDNPPEGLATCDDFRRVADDWRYYD